MTALTAFFTATASTTSGLTTTAKELLTATPAVSSSLATTIAKSTGYIELRAVTTGSVVTAGTPTPFTNPAPSGNGWVWDATTLEGQQLSAGTYSVAIRVQGSSILISSAFYVRVFKRSSGGVYTSIGMATIATSAMAVTATTKAGSFSTGSATTFATGDKLYIDVIAGVTANSANSNASTITLFRGTAGDDVVTPGYVPQPPTITSLSSTYDLIGGGTSITITGTGFTGVTGASGVTFGGTNATSYSVTNDTTISSVVVPAHARGVVDVSVTNAGGSNANTSADNFAYMNAFEAVPAGGTWSTAATWAGGGVPTASSDTYLGSGSGSVTLSAPAPCRSLNCTGYAATLTTATNTVTIGDGTAGAGNVALALSATMTISGALPLTFVSTSSTQQTVTWAGRDPAQLVRFFGAGGSWLFTDALSLSHNLELSTGTLNTNGQNVTVGAMIFDSGGAARTLTLGATQMTCTSSGSFFIVQPGVSLAITANTATVSCAASDATFTGDGVNYNGMTLEMTGSGTATITGANTFGILRRIGTAAQSGELVLGADQTVTTAGSNNAAGFRVEGQSATNRLLVRSDVLGTSRLVSCVEYYHGHVDYRDINLARSAGSSGGFGYIGDAGGNSDWAVTTAAAPTTMYAKMAGNDNYSSAIWFTTSGGSTAAAHGPLPQDTAILDGNSGAFTFTCDMPRTGSIDASAFTGTLATGTASHYGSVTLGAAMTFTPGSFTMIPSGARTLTTAGKTFGTNTSVYPRSGGSSFTLSDNFSVTSAGSINVYGTGTADFSARTVTCGSFIAASGGTSPTIALAGTALNLTATSVGDLFNAIAAVVTGTSTATFTITTTSTSTRTMRFAVQGGQLTLGTLTYTVAGSTGALILELPGGGTNITTLNFSDASNARTLSFGTTGVVTVTNFNVNGTLGKLMSLTSTTPGTPASLAKGGAGTVSCDYLSIQDSAATPSTLTWYAGANSTSVSNNTGWIFTAPPTPKSLVFNDRPIRRNSLLRR